jgi:sugar lactone lactonase YvrE
VWLTRGSTLVHVDPRSDRVVGNYPIPSPISITTGGGSVWVTTQDERLLRYSPTGSPTGALALPGGAVAEYGIGELWAVVYIGSGAVWAIDPGSVNASATVTLASNPIELAVGEGAVWTANGDGTLTRIAAKNARVVRTVKLGLSPSALAAGEGDVWVTVQKPQ